MQPTLCASSAACAMSWANGDPCSARDQLCCVLFRLHLRLCKWKIAKFGTVQEVITKENLSDIYKVDFEIMQIEGKPLSIYY